MAASRKVLLLAQAPLPVDGGTRINAPGIRGWHFALALAAAGHTVRLVAVQAGLGEEREPRPVLPNLSLQYASELEITGGNLLAQIEAEFQPDAVVGASVWPSYLAALYCSPGLPLWGDLFGSPIAEGQAKAALYGDDQMIEPLARFEATLLRRADAVSGVSGYQEKALVGALATLGRLNRHNYGYRLAYTIPAATDEQILPPNRSVLRGSVVPQDAFVVLWSGGYNTWTDIDTLFAGLNGAMAQNPRLHFVSTGGALPPHDNLSYPRLKSLVENSPHRSRYHLLGWQPYDGLHNYYLESDLGIILDKWSYEGVLGSRTRLVDWLKYGLPAIVTLTAELTEELGAVGLAFSFPHGDGPALARLLLELAAKPPQLIRAHEQASAYALEHFHYAKACRPLLDWIAQPRLAPDATHARGTELLSTAPALTNDLEKTLETERQLANYRSQIEAKNTQIADLEAWAASMETALKQRRTLFTSVVALISRLKSWRQGKRPN